VLNAAGQVGEWRSLDYCPGCGERGVSGRTALTRDHYNFLGARVPLPQEGVDVVECSSCGLFYKTRVPTPEFLTEVFSSKAGIAWNDSYDFQAEKLKVSELLNASNIDLLDIGPSNGALLRAFSSMTRRRSGLDLFMHPGLSENLQGEFITGLLDEQALEWSGEPYDVITVFDVFEHFYRPSDAFRNLSALLKSGGYVILETGNAASKWAQSAGMDRWRYTNLFEHHVFWSPDSIRYYADMYGFRLVETSEVDHKGWKSKSGLYKARQLLKYAMWKYVPRIYRVIADRLNEDGSIAPQIPYCTDHFSAVLCKL